MASVRARRADLALEILGAVLVVGNLAAVAVKFALVGRQPAASTLVTMRWTR